MKIDRAENTGERRDCQRGFRAKSLRLTAWGMNAILCDFECGGIAFIPTTSASHNGKSLSLTALSVAKH
ncbi:MAG TPA: hypothetical protein PLD20_31530 [Blastocatellia bacterium]|nr:hypothetical protein [Blastocatellia bacterium]HMV87719.1 hypothetical protein [Blastocatellia bacterium]HMX25479.1 hypothetical protein [Blastocatellia bacterium]HMZ22504.1 hypothetical protein [Blastocatellia bacterium]HNG33577.1 hypothetical protein [Blastocatellia bacterium]